MLAEAGATEPAAVEAAVMELAAAEAAAVKAAAVEAAVTEWTTRAPALEEPTEWAVMPAEVTTTARA